MASTADFKNGMCLDMNGQLFFIVQFQHVKPGKGAAFVRTKLKNVKSGKVIENTFSAGEKVQTARVERRPHQFLYTDEAGYNFMHAETFEQISIAKDLINSPEFLKEGQMVEVVVHEETETVLHCELLQFVDLEITYTEPGVRGDSSSSNSLKQATVETGATVYVPLFCNTGDRVRIDTEEKKYVERVR